jgi:ankyrin repeat protein
MSASKDNVEEDNDQPQAPPTVTVVQAAHIGDTRAVRYHVNKTPGALEEVDEYGDTPLHILADKGDIGLVKFLLKKGADPNRKNKVGSTPLHKAASKGRKVVAEVLLEHKADPNVKNNTGSLPEDITNNTAVRAVLQGSNAVTFSLPVAKDKHGYIIGRGGKNLVDLRNETKTNIAVPPSDDPSNNITITGRKEAVEVARQKILHLLHEAEERENQRKAEEAKRKQEMEDRKKQRDEDKKKKEEEQRKKEESYITANLEVPKDRHAIIIGHQGNMIRELNALGVKVTIPPRDSADSTVKVYGPEEAVTSALKRITDLTKQPRKPPRNGPPRREPSNGERSMQAPVSTGPVNPVPGPSGSDAAPEKNLSRRPPKGKEGESPAGVSKPAEPSQPAAGPATDAGASADAKPKRDRAPRARKDNATEGDQASAPKSQPAATEAAPASEGASKGSSGKPPAEKKGNAPEKKPAETPKTNNTSAKKK